MRASYRKDLVLQDTYQIKGDEAHHLLNVTRVKLDEEILLLNGLGLKIKTKVSSLLKRELVLTKISHEEVSPLQYMDLALGIPKKEALELSLKQAVELGFTKIFLIRAQYSQTKLPEDERLESLLISALEQSNAAFLPLVEAMNWEDLPLSNYNEIMMLDSQYSKKPTKREKVLGPKLLIVGPEGGFSPEECLRLHQFPKLSILNLPTPILRTPTAVATGAGILLGSLLD